MPLPVNRIDQPGQEASFAFHFRSVITSLTAPQPGVEQGSSVPSFEMVMGFLETYRIEIEEFLRETGYLAVQRESEQKDRIKQIPILAWTQAGHWRECAHSQQDAEELIETDSKGTFALRVRGDSMEPEFHQEDIIVM